MVTSQSDVVTAEEQGANRRRAILVLGMHRSGTSALTRLLSMYGASLPKDPIGPNSDNPTGYWESAEIVSIHDEMLAAVGSYWDDMAKFPMDWLDTPAAQPFKARLHNAFREVFGTSSLALLKDPRICRFVPLWISILEAMRIEPHFVIPVRAPLDVASSLRVREEVATSDNSSISAHGGMPEAKGLLLWLRHFLDAERFTRSFPRTFIGYDQLLSDWRATMDKIGRDLGISWPEPSAELADEVQGFLSPEMRHHVSAAGELQHRADITQWLKDAFGWAQRATEERASDTETLDRTRNAFGEAELAFEPIIAASTVRLTERAKRIAMLEKELAAQVRRAEELAAALAAQVRRAEELAAALAAQVRRAEELAAALAAQVRRAEELTAALAEQEAALSKQTLQLSKLAESNALLMRRTLEQDAALAAASRHGRELGAVIAERDSVLASQARREQELVAELARRERALAAREQALIDMYDSTSWQVTAPLRWAGGGVRGLKRLVRLGRRAIAMRSLAPLKLARWVPLLTQTGQLDSTWYLQTYPDVAAIGIDPAEHYLLYGASEMRNPSRHFDTAAYLLNNPDVKHSNLNPLVHYVLHGRKEGRLAGEPVAMPAAEVPILNEIRASISPSRAIEAFDPSIASGVQLAVKAIAFYLPQFHSIAENDNWWGAGFTEWRNVVRGLPRFAGHYQPRIPRDLGFYDLTHPDIMRRQIELAKSAGLSGFCFYFYWFDGKRLLEMPVNMFLADSSLNFPFCLMWANENWTRRWDGFETDVLISQSHLEEDEGRLLEEFHRHFSDPRYIRIAEQPVLIIYRPKLIPDVARTFRRWRTRFAASFGYVPLLLGVQGFGLTDPIGAGLDGAIEFPPHLLAEGLTPINSQVEIMDPQFKGSVFNYEDVVQRSLDRSPPDYPLIRTVMPSWDNEARRQGSGTVYHGSTPQKYEQWLREMVWYAVRNPTWDQSFVFINAWNEWAEAAYLEPDLHYGSAYLNATAKAVATASLGAVKAHLPPLLLVGHDAYNHGAQQNLRAMGQVLVRRFGLRVEFVFLESGPLLPSYRQIAPCSVLPNSGHEAALTVFSRLHAKGCRSAIANTTVSGRVAAEIKNSGLRLLSLIHELPGLIHANGLETEAKSLAEHADLIIFASPVVRDRFRELSGAATELCLVRPQGLYRTEIAADISARDRVRTALRLPVNAKIVLSVGFGDLRKGFDFYMQIAERLSAAHPDLYFLWLGEISQDMAHWVSGPEGTPLHSPQIIVLGQVEEVADYYNAADLFLLTSREDPFPSVVIEALAAGLPVVAFAGTTGCEELVARHGVLVPFADLDALHATVERQLAATTGNHEAADARRQEIATRYNYADYCFWLLQCLDTTLRRVSVVVPNYNHERYLPARLASIFHQDYPVYEVIVLDDASTDRSLEAIESVTRTERREIKLMVNAVNGGRLSDQWKKGLDLCGGDYVWIAESDDVADSRFLSQMVECLEQTGSAFCFCDSWQIDGEGARIGSSYIPYIDDIEPGVFLDNVTMPALTFLGKFLAVKNIILNMSGVLWRRSALIAALEAAGADFSRFKLAADWRLYVQACLQGDTVSYLARPLNGHRRHERGVTSSLNKEAHLAELVAMQALVTGLVEIEPFKQWLARKHMRQAQVYLGLANPHDGLGGDEFDLCEKYARALCVSPVIHEKDPVLRFLLTNASFRSREDAIKNYFQDGRKSCETLRDLLVSLGWRPKETHSMLEVAAGYGCVTRHLSQVLPSLQVASCDSDKDAVVFLTTHFDTAAFLSSPLPETFGLDGEFDAILALSFFSHISEAGWGGWLKALYSRLRPNGYLIFTTRGPTSAKLLGKPEIPASGIWIRPKDRTENPDGPALDQTVVEHHFVAKQIRLHLDKDILIYRPAFWWTHQDLYVIQRS
jgi:glycosyltransferase involved in cell wall biosynthesis